jgi:hypothetical protein
MGFSYPTSLWGFLFGLDAVSGVAVVVLPAKSADFIAFVQKTDDSIGYCGRCPCSG